MNNAPVADAAGLISQGSIGAPSWDAKGGVKVACRTDSGRKNFLLILKRFTCKEALAIADWLDRRYSGLQEIADGRMPEAFSEMISGMGASLTGGELLLKNENVGASASSDPLVLAVVLRLAEEAGRDPALLSPGAASRSASCRSVRSARSSVGNLLMSRSSSHLPKRQTATFRRPFPASGMMMRMALPGGAGAGLSMPGPATAAA